MPTILPELMRIGNYDEDPAFATALNRGDAGVGALTQTANFSDRNSEAAVETVSGGIVITVPHATDEAPPWASARLPDPVFGTHEALDIGAIDLAQAIGSRIGCELIAARASRAYIDMNRERGKLAIPECALDGRLLSFNHALVPGELAARLMLYDDFHNRIHAAIKTASANNKPVLLVDLHSFTRQLGGTSREVDIGVCLSEPTGAGFALLTILQGLSCDERHHLHCPAPRAAVIRRDEPYPGTHLGAFIGRNYRAIGVETVTVEVCDDLLRDSSSITTIANLLARAIRGVACAKTLSLALRGTILENCDAN